MPLKKGSSQDTISSNIREEMHAFDRTGAIGRSHPASRKKAQKQAVAIALEKARESGGGPPKPSAKKSAAKKSTKRGSAAKKSTARKSPAKKTTARKSAAKKSTSRTSTARKTSRK